MFQKMVKKKIGPLADRMSSPAGGIVPRHSPRLTDLCGDGGGTGHVVFGVDLCHVRFAVAEQDLRGSEAEFLSEIRGCVVVKLAILQRAPRLIAVTRLRVSTSSLFGPCAPYLDLMRPQSAR